MNLLVSAYYVNSDFDSSVEACHIKNFDLDKVRSFMAKAEELKGTITNFNELVIDWNSWDADFITQFNNEELEKTLFETVNQLSVKTLENPLSAEEYECERLGGCYLHVSPDRFYLKGFEKYSGRAMETNWITLEDLSS